jgi:4-hydroxybenzoate polyprenyltransferase
MLRDSSFEIRDSLNFLLWTNILIAASAAGWAVVSFKVLHLPVDWFLVMLAFVLALAFYTRDRLDEQQHAADLISMPERTAWVRQHHRALRRLMWGGFAGAVVLVGLRPMAVWPLLGGLGFALSYTIRWLPWRDHRLGWKHLPTLKMPFVALLWTLTAVITPAFVYRQLAFHRTWELAGAVCLLIMVQILLNDLRDRAGDRVGGVASLPVLVGDRAARWIGSGLALLALLLAWPLASISLAGTALYSLILLWGYRRSYDPAWRPFIEGQGLFAACLVELVV